MSLKRTESLDPSLHRLPPPEYGTVPGEDGKHHINIVVIGHVDAGKSTLMGYVLCATGQVSDKTLHKNKKLCQEMGKNTFHYAWVLDEFQAERERGITMDVGVKMFETPTKRVTLMDAPGHKDFVVNMIGGAVQADYAVLVVDGATGCFEAGFQSGGQTKEHIILAKSVGVKQLVVAVNKLDSVKYSQERFEQIVSQITPFIVGKGFREKDIVFIPTSAINGENIDKKSSPELSAWYEGPTLLELIDQLNPVERILNYPLRLAVTDVFKSTTLGVAVSGKVETGTVKAGDRILVMPLAQEFVVKGVEVQGQTVKLAQPGDNIEFEIQGLQDTNMIHVGNVICGVPGPPIHVSSKFDVQVIVFEPKRPITRGTQVEFYSHTASTPATITKLRSLLDRQGKETQSNPISVPRGASAVVRIETQKQLCVETFQDFKAFGRFVLREEGQTIAAGVIKEIVQSKHRESSSPTKENSSANT